MLTRHKLGQSLYLKVLNFLFPLVWLLPNHYPPWGAFHNDAYAALLLWLIAVVVLLAGNAKQIKWPWPTVLVLVCACIPMVQFGFGQIVWLGTAWINSAYLIGLACAMVLGAQWEKYAPGRCGDFIFASLLAAGTVSVVIGWCQWLGLNVSDVWILKTDDRPYANLSQPNQTASLYVLSLIGCAWFYRRNKVGGFTTAVLTAHLLMGLAMTGSRTGWINAALVGMALIGWSYKSKHIRWGIAAFAGLAVLLVFVYLLPWLSELLGISRPVDWASRSVLNGRGLIWSMVLDAATRQPLLGYGWGQTLAATLNAAIEHPQLDATTDHSHNLFLDLVLWNGLILGSVICIVLVAWLMRTATHVKTLGQLLLMLCLCVLALHAMSEFPLNYAYFLLPLGVIVGALQQQLNAPTAITTGRGPVLVLFLCAGIAWFVTVRDYVRIESGFTAIRFESANIDHNLSREPPDVWVLTELRAAIVMARWQAATGQSASELALMQSISLTYPSTNNIYKMALAYGLNGDKRNAVRWLEIGCKTAPAATCKKIKDKWAQDARTADVPWPWPWP